MTRMGNNILSQQIWQRIAALSEARGLDADTLAHAANISPARLQAFAKGTETMRLDDLTGFSQALDMPIAELLEGIG